MSEIKLSPSPHSVNLQAITVVVNRLFPAEDIHVERVLSGISTYVYRILSPRQTYYLRIQPEEGASFAPEVAALAWLRHNHITVPEVVYFEDANELLGRSLMLETEIRGMALSRSSLSRETFARLAMEAGRELARINSLPVAGFGWIGADQAYPAPLRAQWSTWRAFLLEYREADLAYLHRHVLKAEVMVQLERVLTCYDSWLDEEQSYLAHGDFDTTHIFQDQGRSTGIIDFGEVRGTNRWYDLAHFRIRDGAFPSYQLFAALERGYAEITPLPSAYRQHLCFTSVLINIRALSRAFQTRSPDEYIWRQLAVLQEDLDALA